MPAQQVDPLIPWLMQQTGAKKFYLPSADYIWPHTLNRKVREVVAAHGGAIVGEEYFPLDHADYRETVEKITASGADVVFNTIVPPGVTPFLEQLHDSGFAARGGKLVCTYFDENFLNMVPAAHVEGLYSCLDYYQAVSDPFSRELLARYDELYPGNAKFLKIFSTKGAEKRKQHRSKGAAVFRDPTEPDRVWVIFDWDEEGFKNFVSDPEVPPS